MTAHAPIRPPTRRLWVAVAVGYLSFGAGFQVLPQTADERFPAAAAAVATVITLGSLCAAAARPVAGRRADRAGARPVVLTGAALATAGAAIQFAAADIWVAGAGRLLLGAGEGALFTGAVAWVIRDAPVEGRGRLIARFGLSMWGGLTLGPPFAAAVVAVGGTTAAWAACVLLPLGGLAVAATTSERRRERRARRRSTPRMPIGRPALALACAGFGYGTLAGFVVTRMHDGRIGGAGVALGVFGASFLAARWLGGHLVDRVPAARLLAVCAVGQALGLMSVAVASGAVIALLGVACAGAGTALVYPLLTLHASKAVSAEHRGTAVGALTSSWDVGLALAGPVGGAVAAPLGLSGPFVLGAAVALAAPLALRLRRPASVRPATRRRSPVST